MIRDEVLQGLRSARAGSVVRIQNLVRGSPRDRVDECFAVAVDGLGLHRREQVPEEILGGRQPGRGWRLLRKGRGGRQ